MVKVMIGIFMACAKANCQMGKAAIYLLIINALPSNLSGATIIDHGWRVYLMTASPLLAVELIKPPLLMASPNNPGFAFPTNVMMFAQIQTDYACQDIIALAVWLLCKLI